MTTEDDGNGELIHSQGRGLRNLEHRAASCGGTFETGVSETLGGALLAIEFPLLAG